MIEKDKPAGCAPSTTPVFAWHARQYGNPGAKEGQPYKMAVYDDRHRGQLSVEIGTPEEVDDGDFSLGATAEINRLEAIGEELPCLHVHYNNSNLAFSVFRDGGRLIVRPESGICLQIRHLPNGEAVFEIDLPHA